MSLTVAHKKIVNFVYPWLRFCNTLITNKKAHDIIASISDSLYCDKVEILQISATKEKRKRFYVNMFR